MKERKWLEKMIVSLSFIVIGAVGALLITNQQSKLAEKLAKHRLRIKHVA